MNKLFAFTVNGSMFYALSSLRTQQYKLVETVAHDFLTTKVDSQLSDYEIFLTFIDKVFCYYQIQFHPCNIENIFRLDNTF